MLVAVITTKKQDNTDDFNITPKHSVLICLSIICISNNKTYNKILIIIIKTNIIMITIIVILIIIIIIITIIIIK